MCLQHYVDSQKLDIRSSLFTKKENVMMIIEAST